MKKLTWNIPNLSCELQRAADPPAGGEMGLLLSQPYHSAALRPRRPYPLGIVGTGSRPKTVMMQPALPDHSRLSFGKCPMLHLPSFRRRPSVTGPTDISLFPSSLHCLTGDLSHHACLLLPLLGHWAAPESRVQPWGCLWFSQHWFSPPTHTPKPSPGLFHIMPCMLGTRCRIWATLPAGSTACLD